jgi:hypothetical protein
MESFRKEFNMPRSIVSVAAATFVLCLCGVAPAGAQSAASSVAKESGEAWDAVKAYTVEKKNDAVAFGKKIVGETDAKIKDLESKAAQSTGEVKAAHEKNLQDLKLKRAQAAARLDEMGQATGAAWDATKQGFADAYKDLRQAYDKAAEKVK